MTRSIEISQISVQILDIGCEISIILTLSRILNKCIFDDDELKPGDISVLIDIMHQKLDTMYKHHCDFQEFLRI